MCKFKFHNNKTQPYILCNKTANYLCKSFLDEIKQTTHKFINYNEIFSKEFFTINTKIIQIFCNLYVTIIGKVWCGTKFDSTTLSHDENFYLKDFTIYDEIL